MKKFTYKNLLEMLKSKAVLAVSGALVLTSCTIQTGGYSETDGVYYDPNRDTLPEGVVMNSGNQVGDYYDYTATDNQNVYLNSDNRNQKWQDSQNSDWGNFTGTETYYSDNWGYYPYGYYNGFSFGFGYGGAFGGYYSPWGFGYNPWYGYYSPWYGYYSPWYGYYNPYYYGYNYYSPYGYYSPYNYGYNAVPYKRRGAEGMSIGNVNRNSNVSGIRNADRPGFRNTNTNGGFRNDNGYSNPKVTPNYPNNSQPRIRNTYPNATPNDNGPRYQAPVRSNDGGFRTRGESGIRSGNDGGFRSGGESGIRSGNSGGFRSGGFNSGSSSSGTRSSGGGGFRR